jgi:hypothetical protein
VEWSSTSPVALKSLTTTAAEFVKGEDRESRGNNHPQTYKPPFFTEQRIPSGKKKKTE